MKETLRTMRLIAFAVAILAMTPLHAQVARIQSVALHSQWGGLGEPGRSDLLIQLQDGQYAANGRIIPIEKITALIEAIESPRVAEPDPENLGITTQWLQSHVEDAARYATYLDYQAGYPDQQDLFRTAFTNERTIQARLKSLYQSFHTDDYPHISVQLSFDDGELLTVCSDSQHAFMVPWKVTRGGNSTETYNANISRAIFALLPAKFTNREDLTDEEPYATGLLQELASGAGMEVKTRWEALGAQHKAGDALESLKRTYQVRRADVNSYHDLDFGKEWKDGRPHEENLHVDLWRPGAPENFVVDAILLHNGQQTEGVNDLLEKSGAYEQLVLSVGWLKKYLDDHPGDHAWLFYVHGRSLTEKGMRIFAADMKAAGREDLISTVSAVQDKAALLETGAGEYWIILPDKSAILWRWQSLSNVLLWKPKDFPTHECTEYGTATGGCSGTLVSSEGKIVQ
jgi:hypothetical protein